MTDTFEFTSTCPMCEKPKTLTLSSGAYRSWKAGALIQDCFPELTTDQRELIQSGIDADCWNKIFKGEE